MLLFLGENNDQAKLKKIVDLVKNPARSNSLSSYSVSTSLRQKGGAITTVELHRPSTPHILKQKSAYRGAHQQSLEL